MSRNQLLEAVEKEYINAERPEFCVGDTVKVHSRIIEGNKERVQVLQGTVIARKGSGVSETFTIYRIAYGSSMERVFLLNSPKIAKIEVMRKGKVRRAKLYHIRGKQGKAAKIKEKITAKPKRERA